MTPTMNPEVWRAELFDEIRTIADPVELRSLWLGHNPDRISSFREEVAHVFDDLDIDGFLRLDSRETGMSSDMREILVSFRDAFSALIRELSVNGFPADDRVILDDPRFMNVSRLARRFVDRLNSITE
jgi:hypothetical protein